MLTLICLVVTRCQPGDGHIHFCGWNFTLHNIEQLFKICLILEQDSFVSSQYRSVRCLKHMLISYPKKLSLLSRICVRFATEITCSRVDASTCEISRNVLFCGDTPWFSLWATWKHRLLPCTFSIVCEILSVRVHVRVCLHIKGAYQWQPNHSRNS
jgi:hypothetical protein